MRPARPKNSKRRKEALKQGYRSAYEHNFAEDLRTRDLSFSYEKVNIRYTKPVRVGRCGECGSNRVSKGATYTPDFFIDGRFHVELKGRLTASDRTKLALVRSQHPEVDLRILFQADNYCTKLHRERYSEWASRIGFKFAVGKVLPESWLSRIGRSLPQVSDPTDAVHSGKRARLPRRQRDQVHDAVQGQERSGGHPQGDPLLKDDPRVRVRKRK